MNWQLLSWERSLHFLLRLVAAEAVTSLLITALPALIQTFNLASDALIQKSNLSDIESAATELRDAKTENI